MARHRADIHWAGIITYLSVILVMFGLLGIIIIAWGRMK